MAKAYIFPGQGSQYPGMGRDLYESSAQARILFETANKVLGFRITDVMFEGNEEDLKATRVTQPAVFLHSFILAETMPDFKPDMVAGHSLGEFSALATACALSFEDALGLVAKRASAMQECCEKVPGRMSAVIGLDTVTIEDICRTIEGIVIPANYNCEGQVVISGEDAAVSEAGEKLKAAGAKRILPLVVGGAFHSPLMAPAAEVLAKAIESTPFKTPSCPIYQNVTARAETNPVTIKENLLAQLTSPVRWTQSVLNMMSDGADHFIELGPGNVLQGLVKRIASAKGEEVIIEGLSN